MASSSSTSTNTSVSGCGGSGGGGSPCGACKFLRRKCVADCIFAPYFCSEQGAARFAAIHKVFGASNVSKLLLHVPVHDRCEAVVTIAYEAQARIHDPVYGCVAHIFALQQQVAYLQTQLMQAKAQLAQTLMDSGSNMEIQWTGDFNNSNLSNGSIPNNNYQTQIMNNPTPQSSLESAANNDEALLFINQNQLFHESQLSRSSQEPQILQPFPRKKLSSSHADLGELHALALRMMRN
ncbi:LOB domain-containing protein 16 [Cucumis melo var. makuwa]|uniref:LOB domain-containing protein 16 n=3 Tax=Cucumis melo TaxID=3656 RepID=A0A1S3CG76_CUCME|nr:LOB domain-containing protein 16 [Cucumis melo]TYK06450.1 LOB domain-containing protein 16 [Cucumis melo var. makuwa]